MRVGRELNVIVGDAAQRANELIAFMNGFEEAGLPQAARLSRVVARDLLEVLDQLYAERSVRRAMQENYERCLSIIGKAAYDQMKEVLVERHHAGVTSDEGER